MVSVRQPLTARPGHYVTRESRMSSTRSEFLTPVPLAKAYRLLNHGPTILVSAGHGGVVNVMAAAWSMPLDFDPPKVCVVIDKATRTRELLNASGRFALNVPTQAMVSQVVGVGTDSAKTVPDKLQRHGVTTFVARASGLPLVTGCVGFLECDLVREPHNEQAYDLFIGQVVAAWADNRVFRDGRWCFDEAPDELRTLHHVAGGHFFAIGRGVEAE